MPARHTVPASSVTRALSLLGDAWTLLILLGAFRGAQRYNQWLERLGIPRPVLSERLRRLTRSGVLERSRYQSNPPRFDYRLTRSGRDLWRLVLAVWDWERRWGDAAGFALDLVHEPCGRRAQPQLYCARCERPMAASDISRRAGPGAGTMSLAPWRQRRSSLPGLGDRWSMLLIYAGLRGIKRFNEMHAELKVSTHLLSLRLKSLVRRGVFERVRYSERPLRHEYRLTPKGLDVYKLGVFAMYWGDRWLPQAAGAPTIVEHLACGKRLRPGLRCNRCAKPLHQSDCHFVEAP